MHAQVAGSDDAWVTETDIAKCKQTGTQSASSCPPAYGWVCEQHSQGQFIQQHRSEGKVEQPEEAAGGSLVP